MKIVTLLFLICCSIMAVGQDTTFTQEEVVRIYEYIDSLETESQLSNQLNQTLYSKIDLLELSNTQFKELNSYQEQEITLLNRTLEKYKELHAIEKRRWYDKPALWFIAGVAAVYISSEIVSNVSN